MTISKRSTKIITLLFTAVALLSLAINLTGCSKKEPIPYQPPVITTKVVTKAVKAPRPEVKCDFKGENLDPSFNLLNCVVNLKRALESVTEDPKK